MINYEVIDNSTEVMPDDKCVKRTDSDGKICFIPFDEANSDYQRYLRWLENPDADEAQSLQSMTTNRKVCSN